MGIRMQRFVFPTSGSGRIGKRSPKALFPEVLEERRGREYRVPRPDNCAIGHEGGEADDALLKGG